MKIVYEESEHRTFNLGCGYGTSIKSVLQTIEKVLGTNLKINYLDSRPVDVPVNYLDIQRYEKAFGKLKPIDLETGIRMTAVFMCKHYGL